MLTWLDSRSSSTGRGISRQRARGHFFERSKSDTAHPSVIEFRGQGGGDLDGGLVGDQRHLFVRLNAEAYGDGVARSFDERRLDGHFF